MSANRKSVDGIIYNNNVIKNSDAISNNHLVNLGQVNALIASNESKFTIIDGIYDNTGSADSILGLTYAVGDVVYAFETVGAFTAGKIYKCTTAGLISVAVFSEITWKEGMIVLIDTNLTNPNNDQQFLLGDYLYIYDADTNALHENGQFQVTGSVQAVVATVAFNSTTVAFNRALPNGARILRANLVIKEAFNGTGGLLKIGDAAVNDRILQTGDTSIHTYAAGDYLEIIPKDQSVGGYVIYNAKRIVNAYLSGISGATTGELDVVLEYVI